MEVAFRIWTLVGAEIRWGLEHMWIRRRKKIQGGTHDWCGMEVTVAGTFGREEMRRWQAAWENTEIRFGACDQRNHPKDFFRERLE